VSGNATLTAWATGWAKSWGWACKNSSNANDQVCGEAYRRLYAADPSPDKLALDVTMGQMVANASKVTDWNWLDALFMALPTFLEYGAILKNTAYWDKAMAEYTCVPHYPAC
jgi:rhamnogalacturonyl hydrolase YesR